MSAEPFTWQGFFDEHAPRYLENEFTKWTKTEASFLIELFPLAPGARVLDLGCGVGRHAIEVAVRGYSVTGVDISSGMLSQARAAAERASVKIEWVHAPIADFQPTRPYDLVICLCEGGLGLVDEAAEPIGHDLAILRKAYESLKPGGGFVLTALNGYASIRRFTDDHVRQGVFDPATMRSRYQETMDIPGGPKTVLINERLFIPPEMVAMLRHVGFEVDHVWGGTAGEWGRRPLKLDEIEMMIVSRRPSE